MVWRTFPKYKKSKNVIKKLDTLNIKDLKKIMRALVRHNQKKAEFNKENEANNNHNSRISNQYDTKIREHTNISSEAIKSWRQLYDSLNQSKYGFFEGIVTPSSITYLDDRYPLSCKSKIEECQRLKNLYNEHSVKASKLEKEKSSKLKSVLQFKYRDPYISINGVRMRVEIDRWSMSKVQTEIYKREQKEEQEKEEVNILKARVTDKVKTIRKQAKKYNDIESQIKKLSNCPYCGCTLYKSDAHLDHIYPISKGGLSVESNLVFVCTKCNLSKTNLTLRNFIRSEKLDENLVYERLEILKKDF